MNVRDAEHARPRPMPEQPAAARGGRGADVDGGEPDSELSETSKGFQRDRLRAWIVDCSDRSSRGADYVMHVVYLAIFWWMSIARRAFCWGADKLITQRPSTFANAAGNARTDTHDNNAAQVYHGVLSAGALLTGTAVVIGAGIAIAAHPQGAGTQRIAPYIKGHRRIGEAGRRGNGSRCHIRCRFTSIGRDGVPETSHRFTTPRHTELSEDSRWGSRSPRVSLC